MTYTQAIAAFDGNASDMARALGLPASTVLSWKEQGAIPPLRQIQLERVTDGKLRADHDVFAPRSAKKQAA